KTDNAAGEYYITDAIEIFVKEGLKVDTFRVDDITETLGVNDRAQLATA
ncbi:MAG TPA: bifunctional UDP-N-acetylglucosamine diphosphorylase/glucosamine-1-phosphate N-acetyltransferase GlmU, partial [Firmicutes bacterium]|nr:bifunctional UDP-N-acetylglucosamine diphosphorylase/glucosamine-1-phosphate N-acetyltransferase GlmU [Bacillota bacterium]